VDRNTALIAFGFAALAPRFVSIGFRGQERLAAQAERNLAASDAQKGEGPTAWLSSDARTPGR
jgi:hypothetical protein